MKSEKIMKEVIRIANTYQCDIEIIFDLLNEGLTIQDAEEIIREAEY